MLQESDTMTGPVMHYRNLILDIDGCIYVKDCCSSGARPGNTTRTKAWVTCKKCRRIIRKTDFHTVDEIRIEEDGDVLMYNHNSGRRILIGLIPQPELMSVLLTVLIADGYIINHDLEMDVSEGVGKLKYRDYK